VFPDGGHVSLFGHAAFFRSERAAASGNAGKQEAHEEYGECVTQFSFPGAWCPARRRFLS